ncbi:hypothetical protein K431DRAFT_231082 [Polychaeton citri CBS 116435]|uniref:GYF domain-containing protein n=1 Tax=Polychaeton citri CBS 116435 TaxID=1314669 RepID=A0A9P4Q0K3_9PEZI|nr:hypothetical protein K431DRAFT_231082 [Polychaeton citri CBS 116435]
MSHPTSAARPKRAGEDFARQYDNTSKKPRFDHRNPSTLAADAPEDDPVLDADVIGKAGAQTKRNAVNIDGYESDSDNDNFNDRAAEREKSKKVSDDDDDDDDDDDMFADVEEDVQGTRDGDEDEDLAREGKKSRKEVRFMRPEEIEGQVMSSRSGGHVSGELLVDKAKGKVVAAAGDEESDTSSGDEEEQDRLPDEMEEDLAAEIGAGGKKKHAPRLDAFNLRQEEEEGQYDEAGNYVRKATDPDAINDSWLEGLSKKDMRRAKEAQEKREEEKRRRRMEADATLSSDLLDTLVRHLETGETPLEALQRLKKDEKKEKKVPKWKLKRQEKNKMDVDAGGAEEAANGHGSGAAHPAERIRREAVEAITGAADALYSRQQLDIYETERERLLRQYKRETGEDWQPPAAEQLAETESSANGADATFEYRWSDKRDGGQHHGPYDGGTMKAWNEAGYFGEGVEFHKVGTDEWTRLLDVR